MLFGLLSITMDIFKIASYVGYLHCDSAVKVAFPVVQLVFILVQVKIKKSLYIPIATISEMCLSLNNKQKHNVVIHCNPFADILYVDPCQGLCSHTKEPYTVCG